MQTDELINRRVVELAELVRDGTASPGEVTQAHLTRIDRVDGRFGAFERVRTDEALAQAEVLTGRDDLHQLALAGVPIPIKNNIPVAGEATRAGSMARPNVPAARDHAVVARLRRAGAVIIGVTRLPEFGLWGMSANRFGTARNPWDPRRTPGGSSGGSAAAVAAAMAPAAHGNDGLGSIRIPAACCGLFGIKPGPGVVPADIGQHSWYGFAENGPLATTVADAGLVLSVMADRPDYAEIRPPDRLRIAVSTASPLAGVTLNSEWVGAARATGTLLADAGHEVVETDPPYPFSQLWPVFPHWFAAVADETARLDARRLEARTARHARAGRIVKRLNLITPAQRRRYRDTAAAFFADHDVLVTPALARDPIGAEQGFDGSWLGNIVANVRYAPFAGPWNLAGFPAAAVPAGFGSAGMPLSVQLVAADGGESRLLAVARQLEQRRPWTRHAST